MGHAVYFEQTHLKKKKKNEKEKTGFHTSPLNVHSALVFVNRAGLWRIMKENKKRESAYYRSVLLLLGQDSVTQKEHVYGWSTHTGDQTLAALSGKCRCICFFFFLNIEFLV